jgi:lysophospholipase-2
MNTLLPRINHKNFFRTFLLVTSSSSLFLRSANAAAFSTNNNMSPFSVTRTGTTITLSPTNPAQQSGLLVISHGLGDTAEGFADVAQMIAASMPHLKIILPTAPTQPVTMNMGMPMPSWYDITGLDERSNENCKGIHESKKTLVDILEKEHIESKLSYDRMVLMGFSQGGALSLFTGMQLAKEQKLAGIVVMSGYLPAKSQFQITNGLEDVPIMHYHGQSDPMVQVAMAKRSQEVVKENGAVNYELKTYPGLVHSVNMEEIEDIKKFLEKILTDDDTCRITL